MILCIISSIISIVVIIANIILYNRLKVIDAEFDEVLLTVYGEEYFNREEQPKGKLSFLDNLFGDIDGCPVSNFSKGKAFKTSGEFISYLKPGNMKVYDTIMNRVRTVDSLQHVVINQAKGDTVLIITFTDSSSDIFKPDRYKELVYDNKS